MRGVCRESVIDRHPVATAHCSTPTAVCNVSVYFEGGRCDTATYKSSTLTHGHVVSGPALVVDDTSTIVVEPGCQLTVSEFGDFIIHVGPAVAAASGPASSEIAVADVELGIDEAVDAPPSVDLIKLSIFSHR